MGFYSSLILKELQLLAKIPEKIVFPMMNGSGKYHFIEKIRFRFRRFPVVFFRIKLFCAVSGCFLSDAVVSGGKVCDNRPRGYGGDMERITR